MDLSIIIISWNTRELLARCLASVTEDVRAFERSRPSAKSEEVVETFVVDNASADGSAEMVREQFPWVHLVANAENVGFARANNQAITRSRGRYIALLNSDTMIHSGAIPTMLRFLDEHPTAAGCGPLLLNADGSLQASCYRILTPAREFWRLMFLESIWHRATYPQHRWDLKVPRRVEVIKGACLVLRRTALDQADLLDERYFIYTEEMDLCYRLLLANWELWWVPQAVVTHYGEASTRQAAGDMYLQLYRSKAQFHRKFGGERQVGSFRRLIRWAYVPRYAVASLGGLLVPALADRARVIRRLLSELPNL